MFYSYDDERKNWRYQDFCVIILHINMLNMRNISDSFLFLKEPLKYKKWFSRCSIIKMWWQNCVAQLAFTGDMIL